MKREINIVETYTSPATEIVEVESAFAIGDADDISAEPGGPDDDWEY
ncbi:MAG: hypothetical protein LBS01_10455 [Prevotellaceae bacterium]|jgi:hypothetical protein|nr:hypothetical protein [Prevotellaceae bacterium]